MANSELTQVRSQALQAALAIRPIDRCDVDGLLDNAAMIEAYLLGKHLDATRNGLRVVRAMASSGEAAGLGQKFQGLGGQGLQVSSLQRLSEQGQGRNNLNADQFVQRAQQNTQSANQSA